mgnify:CR=1 FL=1
MEIPAGAVTSQRGFLIKRTDMPVTPEWQDKYIETLGQAYVTTLHSQNWNVTKQDTDEGWQAKGWIRYSEDDLARANGGTLDEGVHDVIDVNQPKWRVGVVYHNWQIPRQWFASNWMFHLISCSRPTTRINAWA